MTSSIIKEVGIKKLIKYIAGEFVTLIFSHIITSPARAMFLRLAGSKIGKNNVINRCEFVNIRCRGFSGLKIHNLCYIGYGCMFDLAESISLGNNVTLANRVTIMTHTNVGHKNHPLQKYINRTFKPTILKDGCFIGANATILAGVTIGKNSVVGAGSVVTKNVPTNTIVGGKPAKTIRKLH